MNLQYLGYGNGWKREPLNQFVLAAIVICLIASIILLVALIVVKQATVDWNRLVSRGYRRIIAKMCLSFFLHIYSHRTNSSTSASPCFYLSPPSAPSLASGTLTRTAVTSAWILKGLD